jgi:endogenous inhibitor of DNA gyrase (YacG/DUF329 family)
MPETTQSLRCPVCGKPATEATRPFCGKRCADIDLGRWFTGQYRVPASEDDVEEDPSEPA